MDSEAHIVGWESSSATGATEVMGTVFKNLRATDGTVNFLAIWNAKQVPYTVNHYLEDLTGNYVILTGTDHLTWTADQPVTPDNNHYVWFTDATPYSDNVKADGSTVFTYNYPRISYTLTMNAGRWIDSVTATGTVNTGGVTTTDTDVDSFKYEEPVELSFVLSDWYENPQWSGSNNSDSSFTMPAENISKTAYATPIVYNITYVYSGGNPKDNPTSYTIESGVTTINPVSRLHSDFLWWIGGVNDGEQLDSAQQTVTIPAGSTWHRTYTATWSCHYWYHESATKDACIEDEDTQYKVQHFLQDFNGDYTILSGTTYQTGRTDDPTQANPLVFEWFEVHQIESWIIHWYDPSTLSGMTVVHISYDRVKYEGSTDITTWVTSITHVWENDDKNGTPSGSHQYNDVVTITATTWAGYTFSGWTIEDGSGNDITDQLLNNPGDISTTFNMPASPVVIKANVTTNVYTISIDKKWWQGGTNSGTTYTVEDTVEISNPSRDHSDFVGWSGTDLVDVTHDVTFSGRAYDSTYEAVWRCHTWYHFSGDTECVANTYNVIENDVDWEWHGAPDDIVFTYDQTGTLPVMPSQSWYDFIWWTVEWMSGWVTHYIGEITVDSDDTYIYSGTSLDFMNLTVENGGTVILTARWAQRDDTEYVIYHYYRNINATTYTLSWTDHLTGTTDTDVVFAEKLQNYSWFTYTGWFVNISNPESGLPTSGKVTTGNIEKDGSLAIYLYYDRNKWTVSLSGDEHIDTLSGDGVYDYEQDVRVEAEAKTGYHFKVWQRKADGTFTTNL